MLRALKWGWTALGWLLFAIAACLVAAALWIRRTFGPISVDQLLLHLPGAGGGGATGAESGYVSSFVWNVIAIPLAIVVALMAAYTVARLRGWLGVQSLNRGAHAARRVRLRARTWWRFVAPAAVIAVGVSGVLMFSQSVGLPQYIRSMNTDLTLSAYYASPGVSLSAPEPRNLVLIYLESIETALADGDKFEKNMLAPLELATEDWQSVDVLRQYDGGGWTMAGLVGTQCGVPLRGTHVAEAGKLDVIGADSEEFMPGAVCLGDLLAREGYRNVYLGGADASFASKGVFLASHGYDEVLDLNTWLERGDDEVSAWGLSDRALMQHARETIDRLHEGGQPFNLTMLTLDTHEPAHLFEYCVPDTEVEMTSITECSMQQVAEFIKYLEDKGYLEDTVVVLMGDHERFISDGSDYQELRELEERSIFNRIWSPDTITIEREDIDQLSMFATMIEALGFTLEDHRAGVGVSATVADAPGSILDLGMYQYRDVVQSRSQDLYGLLWGSERIESDYFDPKAAQAATEG